MYKRQDDGMVIIKLFLKIDRKEQKKRFEKLLASKDTAWRVSKGDLKRNHDFKEYKACLLYTSRCV